MNWYIKVLKNYAVFDGRAQRAEYWFFVLFSVLITMGLALIDGALGLFQPDSGVGLLSGLYSLAVLIPSLAVGVRRLHDTGRTGWWLLLGLVPVIGPIILLVFMVFDSDAGLNKYGSNPKSGL